MQIKITTHGNCSVASVFSDIPVITDTQSALDMMMTVQYETGCRQIALNKAAITEAFFILSTGLAGEILQKFMNYGIGLSIYGDFTGYTSKPLKDFIYESNRGKDFFFAADEEDAVNRLIAVKRIEEK